MFDRIVPAVLMVVVGVLVGVFAIVIAGPSKSAPRGEPVVERSFYAERNGATPTGRICSQVLARSGGSVSVAVSCSYPPAESRIADLLEGAGQ